MRLPDDSQASIRSALRRRRRTLGLTQDDAAMLLGMSRVSYHRIETGVRRIRFLEIAAICEAFNCHVGELVQDGQLASAYVHAARPSSARHRRDPIGPSETPRFDPAHHAVAVFQVIPPIFPQRRPSSSSAEAAV